MDMPKTRAGGDHSSRRFDEVIPVLRIRVGFNNPCHRNFLLSVEGVSPLSVHSYSVYGQFIVETLRGNRGERE